jgi:hypothetical protein
MPLPEVLSVLRTSSRSEMLWVTTPPDMANVIDMKSLSLVSGSKKVGHPV